MVEQGQVYRCGKSPVSQAVLVLEVEKAPMGGFLVKFVNIHGNSVRQTSLSNFARAYPYREGE